MDYKPVVVKPCAGGSFKNDAPHSVRFKGDSCSLPFKNQMLISVTLCSGQNCLDVLNSLLKTSKLNVTPASVVNMEAMLHCY